MKKTIPASLYFILYLTVLVLVAVCLVLGSVSQNTYKAVPVAIIKTGWKSQVHPSVTEQQITNVLEGKLSEIPELVSIRSSSDQKQSIIRVFSSQPDESGELMVKIREAIAACENILPQDIPTPEISRALNEGRILLFTLESNKLSPEELRRAAINEIATDVNALPEVQQTVVLGGQENILRICPDPSSMRLAGIDKGELQHEVSRLLYEKAGPATRKNDDFFEGLKNLVLVNAEGKTCLLKDLCTVTMQGEWHSSFSGRHQHRAVTLQVYVKNDIAPSFLREKIVHRLKDSPLVANRIISVNPFRADEKPAYRYISPNRAALICALALLVLLLLGTMAKLPIAKKILSLSAAAIVLALVTAVLFALKQNSTNTNFHFSIEVPDNLLREEREALALKLATKITREKEVEDLVWLGNSETADDPANENKIRFYVRLLRKTDYEPFIQVIRKTVAQETGIRLAELSPGENGFPVLYKVKIAGPEWEHLNEMLLLAKKKIEIQQGVSHVWTADNAVQPIVEWELDRNKMAELGVSALSVDRVLAASEPDVANGVKFMIDCEQGQYEEIRNITVANANGQQIPLSDFTRPIMRAYPKAIYREDRQRCTYLYWMADEEGTVERINEALSSIPLLHGYAISITEGE